MKKVIAISTFLGFANLFGGLLLLQGCVDDGGCGGGPIQFELDSVTSSAYRIARYNDDRYVFADLLEREVSFDSLAIALVFGESELVLNISKTLGNMAYACSPRYDYFRPKAVLITSTTTFDSDHPAGSDLSDLFRIGYSDYNGREKLSEFIEYEDVPPWFDYTLTLTRAPSVDSNHVFSIAFTSKTGKEFSTTLDEILITD